MQYKSDYMEFEMLFKKLSVLNANPIIETNGSEQNSN